MLFMIALTVKWITDDFAKTENIFNGKICTQMNVWENLVYKNCKRVPTQKWLYLDREPVQWALVICLKHECVHFIHKNWENLWLILLQSLTQELYVFQGNCGLIE